MKRISQLISHLREFEADIGKYFEDETKRSENEILMANISQMYDSGENRAGEKIQPPYVPLTVSIKKQKGQPTNRVTLRDTGEFHASLGIEYLPEGFAITADDWKRDKLVAKYGKEILGLQDEFVAFLAKERYLPRMIDELRKAIMK